MIKKKYLGIWMDHQSAHIMELTNGDMQTNIIESTFTHQEKELTLNKGEKATYHKEQHEQLAYYKAIAAVIENYQEVLLFGPTTASSELLNILQADHHFDKIEIETRQAGKMTENQQHAFVKEYFFKHLS